MVLYTGIVRHFLPSANTGKTVMAELGGKLLQLIAERDQIDTIDVAKELRVDHQKIVGAVKSLQSLGDVSTACSLIGRPHKLCRAC